MIIILFFLFCDLRYGGTKIEGWLPLTRILAIAFLYLLPWVYIPLVLIIYLGGGGSTWFLSPKRNIFRLYWNNTRRNSNNTRISYMWFSIPLQHTSQYDIYIYIYIYNCHIIPIFLHSIILSCRPFNNWFKSEHSNTTKIKLYFNKIFHQCIVFILIYIHLIYI